MICWGLKRQTITLIFLPYESRDIVLLYLLRCEGDR